MANEITLSGSLQIANGDFKQDWRPGTIQITQTTQAAAGGVQTIGTSEEAIVVTDVSTPGYAFFRNLDSTNFVTIGTYVSATYYPCLKLKAGEYAIARLDGTKTFYAKADTASVKLQYAILSD